MSQDEILGALLIYANALASDSTAPRISSWDIFGRPYGTDLLIKRNPGLNVLGYSQPSLRD